MRYPVVPQRVYCFIMKVGRSHEIAHAVLTFPSMRERCHVRTAHVLEECVQYYTRTEAAVVVVHSSGSSIAWLINCLIDRRID